MTNNKDNNKNNINNINNIDKNNYYESNESYAFDEIKEPLINKYNAIYDFDDPFNSFESVYKSNENENNKNNDFIKSNKQINDVPDIFANDDINNNANELPINNPDKLFDLINKKSLVPICVLIHGINKSKKLKRIYKKALSIGTIAPITGAIMMISSVPFIVVPYVGPLITMAGITTGLAVGVSGSIIAGGILLSGVNSMGATDMCLDIGKDIDNTIIVSDPELDIIKCFANGELYKDSPRLMKTLSKYYPDYYNNSDSYRDYIIIEHFGRYYRISGIFKKSKIVEIEQIAEYKVSNE